MANYANLEAAIQAAIYNNGQNLITGTVLQSVLLEMVDEMGKSGSVFGGIVSAAFNPPATDSNIFYIAAEAGTYTHFGGLEVSDNELVFFTYENGAWSGHKVGTFTDLINRMEKVENTLAADGNTIDNNMVDELDKAILQRWQYSADGTTYADISAANYGLRSVRYRVPVDNSAKVLHIRFEMQMDGWLKYFTNSTNQPILIVGGSASYQCALRQQSGTYSSQYGILSRRQLFCVLNGSNVSNSTFGDQTHETIWGEPAFYIEYKGNDPATASGYTINLKSDAVEIMNGGTTLESIAIADGASAEAVAASINASSAYLSATTYKVAGVAWADCFQANGIPLSTSTSSKPWVIHSLKDDRWHQVEVIIDYNQLQSWTNIDGLTVKRAITDIADKTIYLGGKVAGQTEMAPYAFRNLHIAYDYEDAEIITYPDNTSGTVERLISNCSPYLMIFEGHGIKVGNDSDGSLDTMDATTDRLYTVFNYLRSKGFVPVSWHEVKDWRDGKTKLPKRCYTLMFDDFRIENYMDLAKRLPFVEYGAKPGLAIITGQNGATRDRSETVTIDGETWTLGECFDAIEKAGWYPCSHTIDHTQLQSVPFDSFLQFCKDCIYSCDKLGIYDDILVYPNGSSYTAQVTELMYLGGWSLGVSISNNGYNCIARYRYRLIRNEIGVRKALNDVLAQIV